MRTIIKASLAVLVGCLLFAPTPATAASVTVDDIIYQQTGTVDASMYSVTADFTLLGNILTIVLTNASSALSGGTAATNLLAGIAFAKAMGAFRWVRDHYVWIRVASGITLVALGLLLFFHRDWWLRVLLNRALEWLGLDVI